jgi:hypothetical protein
MPGATLKILPIAVSTRSTSGFRTIIFGATAFVGRLRVHGADEKESVNEEDARAEHVACAFAVEGV